MARINLLPWREERRRERTRQFGITLVAAAVLALLATLGAWKYMNDWLGYQNQRNQYLETEIAAMDRKIKEIEKLEDTRAKLLARKDIIEQLQRDRSQMVHLFDELARTIPDGVYLTALNQSGNRLTLNGIAQSSARVSAYMRNIQASKWLHDPELEIIETVDREGEGRVRRFTLRVSTEKAQDQNGEVFGDQGGSQ